MDIYILMPTKKIVHINESPNITLKELKHLLMEEEGVPVQEQSWRFRGKLLEDDIQDQELWDAPFHLDKRASDRRSPQFELRPLEESQADYELAKLQAEEVHATTISMNKDATPGALLLIEPNRTLYLRTLDQQGPIELKVHPLDTIDDVRVRFTHRMGYSFKADDLRLVYHGQGIENGILIDFYPNSNPSSETAVEEEKEVKETLCLYCLSLEENNGFVTGNMDSENTWHAILRIS